MKINDLKNNDNPTAYILVGAPCSGKSTWSKTILAKDPSFQVISTDDILEEYAEKNGINYGQAWERYFSKAAAIAKQKFQTCVQNKENVIYDQTNMSRKKRRSILSSLSGYNKIAVVFDATTPELFKRNKLRAEKTGKHVPEHVILSMLKNFDPIDKSAEGFNQIIRV